MDCLNDKAYKNENHELSSYAFRVAMFDGLVHRTTSTSTHKRFFLLLTFCTLWLYCCCQHWSPPIITMMSYYCIFWMLRLCFSLSLRTLFHCHRHSVLSREYCMLYVKQQPPGYVTELLGHCRSLYVQAATVIYPHPRPQSLYFIHIVFNSLLFALFALLALSRVRSGEKIMLYCTCVRA